MLLLSVFLAILVDCNMSAQLAGRGGPMMKGRDGNIWHSVQLVVFSKADRKRHEAVRASTFKNWEKINLIKRTTIQDSRICCSNL